MNNLPLVAGIVAAHKISVGSIALLDLKFRWYIWPLLPLAVVLALAFAVPAAVFGGLFQPYRRPNAGIGERLVTLAAMTLALPPMAAFAILRRILTN